MLNSRVIHSSQTLHKQVHLLLTARDTAGVPDRFMFTARCLLLELAENLLHCAADDEG